MIVRPTSTIQHAAARKAVVCGVVCGMAKIENKQAPIHAGHNPRDTRPGLM